MRRRKKLLFACIILVLTTMVGLFVFELLLQARSYLMYLNQHGRYVKGRCQYHLTDNAVMRYAPNVAHVDAMGNPYFQRDGGRFSDDVPTERLGDSLRIAVLGDSVAAQWTYPEGLNFTNRLGDRLDSDRGVELLNWSVHGYSTKQEVELFKEKVLKYRPDVLVLECCLNDLACCGYPLCFMNDYEPNGFKTFKAFEYAFLPTRHVVRTQFLDRLTPENARRQRDSLIELKRLCDANGIQLVVAMFPFFSERAYDQYKELDDYRLMTRGFFKKSGIDHVDLKEELPRKGIGLDGLRFTSRDIVHCNQRAHMEIGWILSEKLARLIDRRRLGPPRESVAAIGNDVERGRKDWLRNAREADFGECCLDMLALATSMVVVVMMTSITRG